MRGAFDVEIDAGNNGSICTYHLRWTKKREGDDCWMVGDEDGDQRSRKIAIRAEPKSRND